MIAPDYGLTPADGLAYTITLESFGYLHEVPEGDGYAVDLRHLLKDPHVDPQRPGEPRP